MRRFSLFVLCAALLVGCSDRSFIGKRYDNFTAFYNTFYNAQKAFDKGVEAMNQSEQPIDRTTYLPLFRSPAQTSNTQAFEDAISKSADVLREHPNSKWVDDALLMIGKSYFYQRNYVGAEQKFREVIGLGSGLEGEARFWLARSLIAAGRYAAADEHLRTSLALDDDFGRWTAMMSLAQGELAVKRENWSAAAEALARGLEGDVGGDEAARAAFLLGQVQETLGNFEAAAAAYERAASYRARYELNYAARISAVRASGLHGQPEQALNELRSMESDDKNFEKRAELRLLRGRLYQAMGRTAEARSAYRELLYGDDAAQGEVAGRTHYALGLLYRDALENYSVAAAHFDTASASIRPPGGSSSRGGDQDQPTPAPSAITDSEEQAAIFGEVADKSEAVARLDSLLRLGTMGEQDFRRFVADLRAQRAREQAQQEQARRDRESARRFNAANASNSGQREGDSPTTAAAATGSSDAGFLFHNDLVRAQQARRNFEQQWGRRPLVPNWRRRTAIVNQTSTAEGAAEGAVDSLAAEQPGAIGRPAADAGREASGAALVDISDVPRDSASQAQMRNQRALARYELGNALFLAVGRPDSAITWYRRVVENAHNASVARRALYALAEAHSALGDSTRARELYRRLLTQHPDSEFARRAREQLGVAPAPQAAPSDSMSLAETAYASAYDAWQNDRHDDALQQMVRVAQQFPQTTIAPRALLAAGSIFMEQRPPDSLTATTPLPDVFTSILEAQPKITAAPDSAQSPALSDSTRRSMQVPGAVGDSTRAARPDSMRRPPAASDSLQRRPPADSTARPMNSDTTGTSVWPDSVVAADSTARSSAVVPDSARADAVGAAPADTLRSSSVGDSASSDPAADKAPAGPVLRTLFSYISEQYPQSPQADRASRVLDALDAAAGAAASDSTAAPDSAAAPDVPSDTSRTAAPADTLGTPPSNTSPPPDSAAAPDSTALPPPPSPRADPDTAATPPDTSSALPGPRSSTPPDSSAQQRN